MKMELDIGAAVSIISDTRRIYTMEEIALLRQVAVQQQQRVTPISQEQNAIWIDGWICDEKKFRGKVRKQPEMQKRPIPVCPFSNGIEG